MININLYSACSITVMLTVTMNASMTMPTYKGKLQFERPGVVGRGIFFLNISIVMCANVCYRLEVLNVGPEHSVNNLGMIRWKLALCLILAWILVVMFVSRGIKSTGKVSI